MINFGQLILDEIIKQGMVSVADPDPDVPHVFVWNGNAISQLDSLIKNAIQPMLEDYFIDGYQEGSEDYQKS